MKGRTIRSIVVLSVGILVLMVSSCPNNLIEVIDEEVEVVVTPPSILSIYPEADTTGFDVDDEISIVFSKEIESRSVNGSSFILQTEEGTSVSGRYTVSNDTVTFIPNNLMYSTVYTAIVNAGILDIDENNLVEEFSWNFTTEEAPAGIKPIIQFFDIDSGRNATNSADVELGIYATDHNGSTSGLQFHYRNVESEDWNDWQDLTDGSGSVEVTLDITEGVTESFEFEAEVRDANGIAADVVSAEITYETTAPSVIDVSWDDESVFPYNGSAIRITFDEEMSPGSFTESDLVLERVSDNVTIEGMISLNASDEVQNIIAELWGLELDPNTEYRVTLQPTVTDIAGNPLGGTEMIWYFSTGDATDTDPPDGPIVLGDRGLGATVVPLPTGATATDDYQLRIDITDVSDDYNTVWGVKFWGDSDGSEASFEETASWELYEDLFVDPNYVRDWNVSNSPGTKFVLYKFMDSAGNITATPGQLKVILDTAEPDTPVVEINDGDEYTNDPDGKVVLTMSSYDAESGVKEMMIGNDASFTGGVWQDWEPTLSDWELPETDDNYTVYLKVRDYLDQESAVSGTDDIILDRTAPVVVFNTGHIIENGEVQLLEGNGGSDLYELTETNPISEYLWEQISGPGTLYFNGSSGGGTTNDGTDLQEPYVFADGEGAYFIQLNVTDGAGNSSSSVVPFTWDVTDPGTIENLSVEDLNNGYVANSQPTWTWDEVADADFYRISFSEDFSTYEDSTDASYSPNTALSQGVNTLYVKAGDNAGNFSAYTSLLVQIDSLAPEISVDTTQYVANYSNPSISIDFSGEAGSDGSVSDSGSNVETYAWAQSQGTGTLTFGSPSADTTTVSADTDGTYSISLTTTDTAGNESVVYLPLLRDITRPSAPDVTGPDLTPSQYPTWYWTSGGGGIGVYKYQLDGGGWSAETDDTSFTGTLLANYTDHTLEVREKDNAENWSTIGSKTIHVDTSATTPPIITIGDSYPTLRNVNTITWDVYTGSGGAATNWRYQLDGTSGSWTTVGTALPEPPAEAATIDLSGLSDGSHTIYVQEYIDEWEAEIGSHTIIVDTTPPSNPNIDGSGYDTDDADRTATTDTTPTWTWSSGGGGNGQFEVQFDGGSVVQTTNTNYTPSSRTDDTYPMAVRERDQAGNWSNWVTHYITVDTTPPVLTGVTIRGTSHPDDSDYTYTRSTGVYVDATGNITAEGGRAVRIQYYDYNPSGWKEWGSYFTGSSETISTTVTSTNGTKTIYIRLLDEAGNASGLINDTIILDSVAPTGTFAINNGEDTTPSLSFKMNFNVTDNYTSEADLEVRSYDPYDAGWLSYRPYATTMNSDFQFSKSAGYKYTYVSVRDQAGNTLSLSDDITLQVPVPTHAWKGYYSTGATRVYYTPVDEDPGSNTTYYYTYSSTNPNLNPNVDDSGLTYLGGTSSTQYDYVSVNPEELTYFWVRAYNYDTGGWGPYSASSVLGYSSNITIVYDDTDGTDEDLAQYIKTVLQSDLPASYPSSITGTMPTWTVTLLPEDLVQGTYYTDGRNIIYGDPVIITHSAQDLYATPNKVRNIVAGGHGIIAMSFNGLRFIDVASDYWVSWGYPATASTDSDQQPNEIGYGNSYTYIADKYYMYTWRSGNSTWTSPLSSTSIPTSTDENQVQIGYSSAPLAERGLYRPGRDNPTRGWLYGRSQDYTDRFPVVRQGRFLYYGYDGMWTRPYTGWVYFINLVSRMTSY